MSEILDMNTHRCVARHVRLVEKELCQPQKGPLLERMEKNMEEALFEALQGLLTTGAVFDPETDPKITAAIRQAVSVMDKARQQRRKPS